MIGTEPRTLDATDLLTYAMEIGDMINASREVAEYLYWKQAVETDPDVQAAIRRFQRAKEFFEECKRFGHFHPNYHEALERANAARDELDRFEPVRRYKAAEAALDVLFREISETIAHAVSDSIKVPADDLLPTKGGCGGACSGKCG